MSDLKKEVTDKVLEIKNTITDENEEKEVLKKVSEIIDIFSEKLLDITKRQNKLEERTEEVFEMLSNIEEELFQAMALGFNTNCPYCGEDIAEAIPGDGSEFECPHCHNIVELEMMLDEGCGCDCDECDGECDANCDCDECGDDCNFDGDDE